MKHLLLVIAISLTGCAHVELPDGDKIWWIAPLPSGTGTSFQTSGNAGVSVNSYTVSGGGSSSSFSVISGARGR